MPSEIDEQAFKHFERDGYSGVAEGYANKTALVSSQANDAILDAAAAGSGTLLLDVACGPGFLTAAAVERGAVVTALDFAPNMVALARSRCPESEICEGDAESLHFEDGQFDAVVCSLGILHFPNPEIAVAEAYRVLKTNGRYAFTCWTPPTANPFMGLILGSIQAHGTMEIDLPAGPPLFRFGDPAECENILRDAGFAEIATSDVPLYWPCATAEELVEELPSSTARLGPMLAAQTEEQRKRIEQAICEGAKKYEIEGGIRIPSSVILASGRKP